MKKVKFILLLTCVLCFNFHFQRNQFYFNEQDGKNARNIEPLLSDIYVGSYIVPGVSELIPSDQILKIGYLNDMNHTVGDYAWKGALLAAREINEEGGILVNGTQYYIGLVSENTNEAGGSTAEGVDAAENMINKHHPHFITGGFGGSLVSYIEVIMNNTIPFICTGAPTTVLSQNVLDDYERYKYFFKLLYNDSGWRIDFITNIQYLVNYLNATYGGTVDKIAIIREELGWASVVSFVLNNFLPNITVVEDIVFPFTATLANFETYWNQIEAAEAQIVVPVISWEIQQAEFMAQQYQAVKPHCLIFGVNLPSQMASYWDNTNGACQFEITFQGLYNVSRTSLTIPFWNSFIKEYGTEPMWAGATSYDAVYMLAHAVLDAQTFDSDTIVTTLEKINTSNAFTGTALYAFTPSHENKAGWPYSYSLLCQWKYIDGTKEVIPSPLVYPDSIATGLLRLPYWGINGLLTDPPDPPGDFTLDTDAGNPDYDGQFDLNWTVSEGADNYSIYMSDESITYISKKFDVVAYQTPTSPFSISLKQGDYYFRVVAYNSTGETMSSNSVHVTIPGPEPFILTSTAGNPDTDGNFDLVWTNSERAVNYSVYRYKTEITSLNGSLTLLANQTAQSPFSISGSSNGKYYFAVAAYNEMGLTLSNNVYIVVQIPFDMTVILIVTISSAVGVASIGLGRRYLKHKGKIKAERERREPIIVEDMTRDPLERTKTGEKKKVEAKNK